MVNASTTGSRSQVAALKEFRRRRRVAIREAWRDWVVWLVFVAAMFVLAYFSNGLGQLIVAACIGALLTVGAVGWLIGGHVSSLTWMWGAEGERHTAAELERLRDTWRVVHDVADGKGNWDHVAIARQGVYLIDSKTFHGRAIIDGDGLRSGRIRTSGSSCRGQAARLKETLERETDIATWAQAVVAVWGEFPEGEVERKRVVYLDATRLCGWLESRPIRLSREQVDRLADALEAL